MSDEVKFPQPLANDPEDVTWALSTAQAMWVRGDQAEAIRWVKRAAESAADASDDDRALDLARAAADLKSASPPAVTPPPSSPFDAIPSPASSSGAGASSAKIPPPLPSSAQGLPPSLKTPPDRVTPAPPRVNNPSIASSSAATMQVPQARASSPLAARPSSYPYPQPTAGTKPMASPTAAGRATGGHPAKRKSVPPVSRSSRSSLTQGSPIESIHASSLPNPLVEAARPSQPGSSPAIAPEERKRLTFTADTRMRSSEAGSPPVESPLAVPSSRASSAIGGKAVASLPEAGRSTQGELENAFPVGSSDEWPTHPANPAQLQRSGAESTAVLSALSAVHVWIFPSRYGARIELALGGSARPTGAVEGIFLCTDSNVDLTELLQAEHGGG